MSAGDASPSTSGSGNSESELHLKNLQDLCRICFRIINSTCYEVKNFSEDLDAAFRANCNPMFTLKCSVCIVMQA